MWFQDIKFVQGCKYYTHSIIIAEGNEDVKLYITGRMREGYEEEKLTMR